MSDFSRRDRDPVGDDDPDAPGDGLSDELTDRLPDVEVSMTDAWAVAPAVEDPWLDESGVAPLGGLGPLGGVGPLDGDDLEGGWASDASI